MANSPPTITCLIPTPGQGRPLKRCLHSVAPQLRDGDEVLVIGDTHDGPLPEVESVVASFGPRFRYLPYDAGHHCWGHCQLNAGIALARGAYLSFNDDDDVYAPRALESIRRAVSDLPGPRPLLFRFVTHYRLLLGVREAVEPGWVGGHMLVCPNVPGKVGRWTERYEGDFDFIVDTISCWPEGPLWRPEVIALARPGVGEIEALSTSTALNVVLVTPEGVAA